MTGYPTPSYGPLPTYGGGLGDSCKESKPSWYYSGGNFCEDVEIQKDLTVLGTTTVGDIVVDNRTYVPTLAYLYGVGWHWVLASAPGPGEEVPPAPIPT